MPVRAGSLSAMTTPAPEKRLVVAGDAFEDIIFAGLPRMPRPGEEVRTPHFARTFGGGALITAAWARGEGVNVSVFSALPPRVPTTLRAEGIPFHNLRRTGEPHAITACLSCGKDRAFATFDGANLELERRLVPALLRPGVLTARDTLHLATSPRAPEIWLDAMRTLVRRGAPGEIFWDFGYDRELPRRPGFGALVAASTGVFVNHMETQLYDFQGDLTRAAAGGTVVVVKRGGDGAETLDGGNGAPAPAPILGVRDTTGAGDAFAAGFLAQRLDGGTLRQQLLHGNALGAACVQRLGGLPKRPWRPAGNSSG